MTTSTSGAPETAADSYPPTAEFAAQANATSDLYAEAEQDRLAFWAKQARRLHWHTPFTEVLDWSDAPVAKWFADGKLNVAYNCVDRHVEAGHGDRIAYFWEGEPGDSRDNGDRGDRGDHRGSNDPWHARTTAGTLG